MDRIQLRWTRRFLNAIKSYYLYLRQSHAEREERLGRYQGHAGSVIASSKTEVWITLRLARTTARAIDIAGCIAGVVSCELHINTREFNRLSRPS